MRFSVLQNSLCCILNINVAESILLVAALGVEPSISWVMSPEWFSVSPSRKILGGKLCMTYYLTLSWVKTTNPAEFNQYYHKSVSRTNIFYLLTNFLLNKFQGLLFYSFCLHQSIN